MHTSITILTSLFLSISAGGTESSKVATRIAYVKNHFGEMRFGPEGGLILRKGQRLPRLVWEEPEVAAALLEDDTIPTRWFDSDFNEVTTAERTGTYYVYGEAPAPSLPPLRRAMTCYCVEREADLVAFAARLHAGQENNPQEIVKRWQADEDALVTMIGMMHSKPPYVPPRPGQWHMENATVHVRLKRRLRNITAPPVKVAPRPVKGEPAPVLAKRPEALSDADRAFGANMEALFDRWHKSSAEPMSVVAARRGNILVSRGYGQLDGKPITVNTPMLLHSAMKPIMGIQLAMHADRGIVALDQPIGDYLPEFDTSRDRGLTFRAGHLHVTGIHFPWDLAFSRLFYFHTWHEALIAHCPREWEPGEQYRYGVVGIILAVRSLELLTAKNYWEAAEEQLLKPLGMKDMHPGGTGFSAEDLARLGVLMANRGKYGDLEFFSEAMYEEIVPVQLKKRYPGVDANVVRGVGFAPMGTKRYGHGGGCGTYLLIDPAKHFVFAMTRMGRDPEYQAYHAEAVVLIDELLKGLPDDERQP